MMNKTMLFATMALAFTAHSYAITDVAIESVKLSKKMKAQHTSLIEQVHQSTCRFSVNPYADHRQNKATISWSVNASDVQKWLNALSTNLVAPITHSTEKVLDIELSPQLKRLYTYNESMNINGMAVSTVDFKVNGQPFETQNYRGFYSKTNWANGDGEFIESAERATHQMILNMLSALPQLCKKAISA